LVLEATGLAGVRGAPMALERKRVVILAGNAIPFGDINRLIGQPAKVVGPINFIDHVRKHDFCTARILRVTGIRRTHQKMRDASIWPPVRA
jgi:hypothetical protein